MRMQKGANQGSIYRVAERRSAVHFPRNSLEKKKKQRREIPLLLTHAHCHRAETKERLSLKERVNSSFPPVTHTQCR